MRDGSMLPETMASSNFIRSSADIELASLVVPNGASPQFCESNHWQCLMNRSRSGDKLALNGVTTGASTPRMRLLMGSHQTTNREHQTFLFHPPDFFERHITNDKP